MPTVIRSLGAAFGSVPRADPGTTAGPRQATPADAADFFRKSRRLIEGRLDMIIRLRQLWSRPGPCPARTLALHTEFLHLVEIHFHAQAGTVRHGQLTLLDL